MPTRVGAASGSGTPRWPSAVRPRLGAVRDTPNPGTVGTGVLGGAVFRFWDQGLPLDDEKRHMEGSFDSFDITALSAARAAATRHRVEVVAQECWLVMVTVMFCE